MPPIAVLAGGLATRMRPITERVPKAMIEVAGEPFVAHQLRLLAREGFSRVVLLLGYLGEQVVSFVGDGSAFGLEVTCSYDGDKLLGTGGALRKALVHLGPEFAVIYGDSYLDIPYAPVVESYRDAGKPALMTVLHNRGQWDTSNVEFENGAIIAYSKTPTPRMAHIDYGLSVLNAGVFDGTPSDEAFDLGTLYKNLVENKQMAGYEVNRRFYEIGSRQGLAELEVLLDLEEGKA